MGNADSITAAYGGWQEDSGDVDKLREYITKNKQHIEEKNFKVCIKRRLSLHVNSIDPLLQCICVARMDGEMTAKFS